jgi:acyl-CoA synthetase (NDP forming)
MAGFDLTRLTRPRNLAVFGGAAAAAVIRECDRMGFFGPIWPVHPTREEIGGHRCFRAAEHLPEPPDAAFIGVNRHATVELAATLSEMGAGGAVSYASGFSEVGPDGAALQAALVAAAGDMPVVGPNCYGLLNYLDGIAIWPDVHGGRRVDRGVALVTQSSNIAINLTMARRGLPIGFVLALGNQAMVGLADAIRTLALDPRISAIGLHVEGLTDPEAFAGAVAFARARGKPIVALKAGRSALGRAIAMTHTASLAGSDRASSAYLKRLGVAEVRSIPALMETLKVLHVAGPMQGRGLASLSCSGGEASIMSDAVEGTALAYPPFDAPTEAAIRATVDPLVTVSNPFDYHTFDWGKRDRLTATFGAVLRGPQDMTLLVLDWPSPELGPAPTWDIAAEALVAASRHAMRPAAVLSTLPETMPPAWADRLARDGVVPLVGITEAMIALEAAGNVHAPAAPRPAAPVPLVDGEMVTLSEAEAKAALARFGVVVPRSAVATSREDALRAAEAIAEAMGAEGVPPLVAKALGRHLAHKTESGAVILNIRDEAALAAAYDRLAPLGDAVLVEAMVTDAVAELIVGVARDPVIGLHLVVGAGGVDAELLADTAVLCLPADRIEIEDALAGLKVGRRLAGWRGKPPGDMRAAVEAVLAIAAYAEARADRLVGLDVNPLMVRPHGDGAVAVDALITLKEPRR